MRGTKPNDNPNQNSDAPKPKRKAPRKLVGELIAKAQTDLLSQTNKLSLADLIRLLQMEKELKQAKTTEIRFRWVKPGENAEATKE